MAAKMSVYEVVTARILEALAQGTVPWRRTWNAPSGASKAALPSNLVSGKTYRGINLIMLWSAGFADSRFLTFNQAKQLGGSVRKGEHGMPIVFWKVYDDAADRRRFVLRYSTVFNVSQCDGLPAKKLGEAVAVPASTVAPIDACEAALKSYPKPPTIGHGGERAFYQPSADSVQMPPRNAFESPEAYYATLFHELGHSTGHASRLARKVFADKINFGDHAYSFEELVAECTAAFLCAETGIATATIENSASYVANWIKSLKNDPEWIVKAASAAAKAADLILNRSAKSEESADEVEQAA